MKRYPEISLLIGSCAIAMISTGLLDAATFATVGVYDPTAQANFVDHYGTTQTPTPTATSGEADPPDGYKAAFASGFTAGFGGVVNFEAPSDSGLNTTLDATYAGGTKTLNLGVSEGFRWTGFGTSLEISGGQEAIFRNAAGDVSSGTFTMNSITGGLPMEQVVRFGLTFLGRNNTGTVTGQATYNDLTTSPVLSRQIASGSLEDTFFGFTAPEGKWITSVSFTGTQPKTFDDLGFVTAVIPEPSLAALGGLGALVMLCRRRR